MEHDKQWYVEQHRAMWNWIADKIEATRKLCIVAELKYDWCEFHSLSPEAFCFACEYKSSRKEGFCCRGCLFNWGNSFEFVHCMEGYYERCRLAKTWQEQARLARKIANLPVREEV